MNHFILKSPEEVVAELNARGFYPDCSALKLDTRELTAQDILIAVPGKQFDPRRQAEQLIQNGSCALVLAECDKEVNYSLAQVISVKGLKSMLAEIACLYYGHPSAQLKVIAVTGTNGKTSVTRWLAQLLNHLNLKAGVIGTLGFGLPDQLKSCNTLTTPDSVSLQRMLYDMKREGFEWVCLEASSIGLEQGRLNGVRVVAAIYTNLTQDHLDYHQTMLAYKKAKERLARFDGLECVVVNADDQAAIEFAEIVREQGIRTVRVGRSSQADLKITDLQVDQQGAYFNLGGQPIQSGLYGVFNVYNLALVLSILQELKIASSQKIASISAQVTPPPGRMQIVYRQPVVIVDYAHTPDALRQVLESLSFSLGRHQSKLRVVFGCGGDREKQKRPLMAAVAAELADFVYLTSDNPRSENPQTIIQEMLAGIAENKRNQVYVEANRDAAIRLCLSQSGQHDVVVLAGKGHEEYQLVQGQLIPHSDAKSVAHFFQQEAS